MFTLKQQAPGWGMRRALTITDIRMADGGDLRMACIYKVKCGGI
jgi:hypothetical protein